MSKENCCLCFPIDCGIKTLAVYTILGVIGFCISSYLIEGSLAVYWPIVAAYGAMALVWVYNLLADSESSRKFSLLAWIALVCVVGRCWYLYVILNGSALDLVCTTETIEQAQTAADGSGLEPITITEENCKYGGKTGMLIDCVVGWLIEIYWATAIMRWSKLKDDQSSYEKI